MRVILVNAPQYRFIGGSCNFTGVGLTYIAQVLKNNGHEVKIFNADKDNNKNIVLDNRELFFNSYKTFFNKFHSPDLLSDIVKKILSFNPDVVGFYVYSNNRLYIEKIIKEVKNMSSKKIRFIAGGIYFRLYSDKMIEVNTYPFDSVCVTEGENCIENMLYNDGVFYNDKKVKDINIDKDVFYEEDYLSHLQHIEFSRGCPFQCVYCVSGSLNSKIFYRDISTVIKDIEYRKSLGVNHFIFIDELFINNKKRLIEFANKLKSKISFTVETRVDSITDESIKILKNIGCDRIKLGVEYGTEKEFLFTNKNTSLYKISIAFDIIKRYDINIQCNNILGAPDCNSNEYLNGIKFLKKLNADWYSTSVLMPFHGTVLYENMKNKINFELEYYLSIGLIYHPSWYDFWNINKEVIDETIKLNENKKNYLEKIGYGERIK